MLEFMHEKPVIPANAGIHVVRFYVTRNTFFNVGAASRRDIFVFRRMPESMHEKLVIPANAGIHAVRVYVKRNTFLNVGAPSSARYKRG